MADAEKVSASIANSKFQHHGVAAAFVPVFQTLNSWESDPYSRVVSGAGVILEALQFLSFALCPYFLYQQPIVYEIVTVVWATVGPLWYRPFGPFDYTYYIIAYVILAAVVFSTIAAFGLLCAKVIESTNITASSMAKHAAESIAGWLFLPLMHTFLGGMSCHDGRLINFPEQQCWEPVHLAVLLIGIFAIIGTVAVGFVIAGSLGDLNPQSTRIRSRAHSYAEVASLAVKLVLVIFFHILVERGAVASYNIILVIGAVGLLCVQACTLPFYHHWMNRFRCSVYAATAFVGVVNCITAYSGESFAESHVNSFVVAALIPFAFYFGVAACDWRLNPEFTLMLESLMQTASAPRHAARFPFLKGVMSNDAKMIPSRFRTLESDIIHEHGNGSGSGAGGGDAAWEELVSSCAETLVPYIESVRWPADAEIACRFIHHHASATNLPPSASTLAFATRIHFKSIVLFKRSGIARFQFANFLYVFANRLNMALQILSDIDAQVHNEHDAVVLYASFKIGIRVKELFGVRDNTHLVTVQRARQYHKEALSDMAQFWAKLLESKGDVVGLALLTNQLTVRRQNALDEYDRALLNQKGDRQLLTAFSAFLEFVMSDTQGAEVYKAMADEVAEEKKNRIMRGSRAKSDVGGGAVDVAALAEEELDDENAADNSGILSMLRSLFILLSVTAACAVALSIMQTLRVSLVLQRLEGLSSMGQARSFASETILQSHIVNNLWNAAGCANTSCKDTTLRQGLYNLSLSDASMRAAHNAATYGSKAPSRTSMAMQYVASLAQSTTTFLVGDQYLPQIFSYFGRAAQGSFSQLAQEAEAAASYTEPWMNVHKLSTAATQLVNNMYDGLDYNRSFTYLTSPLTADGLQSIRNFAVHQVGDIVSISGQFTVGIVVVFALGLGVIGLAYLAFYSSLQAVGFNKVMSLKLFTYIPYLTQESLYHSAQQRMEQFEALSSENEKDVGANQDDDLLGDTETSNHDIDMHIAPAFGRRRDSQMSRMQMSHSHKPNSYFDDDVRKMSRWFGTGRSSSQGQNQQSILKNPSKPKPKKKKRVQFKIEGEVHDTGKKLREPKVKLTSKPTDLVMDLEQSMRDIEQQSQRESQQARVKQDEETEKMISSGLRTIVSQRHTKKKSVDDDKIVIAEVWERVLRPLCCLLMAGALVTLILASSSVENINASLGGVTQTATRIQQYLTSYWSAQVSSVFFANFGRTEHYATVLDFVNPQSGYGGLLYVQDSQGSTDLSLSQQTTSATRYAERALQGTLCSLALASRALAAMGSLALDTVPEIALFACDDTRRDDPMLFSRYPRMVSNPDQYIFNGTHNATNMAGAAPEGVLKVALSQLGSERAKIDSDSMISFARSVRRSFQTAARSSALSDDDQRKLLCLVAVACSAAAAMILLVKLLSVARQEWAYLRSSEGQSVHSVDWVDVGSLAIVFVLSITALGLASSSYSRQSEPLRIFGLGTEALTACNNVFEAQFDRQRFALLRYLTTGSNLTLVEFNANYSTSEIDRRFSSIAELLQQVGLPNFAATVSDALRRVQFFLHIQRVSMWLARAAEQKASGQPVSPSPSAFLSTYDYSQEAGYSADTVSFAGEAAYQYSTPAVDSQRTASDLYIMARQAIYGRRGYHYFSQAFDMFSSKVLTPLQAIVQETIVSGSQTQQRSIQSCAGIAGAASGVALFAALLPALRYLWDSVFGLHSSVKQLVDMLFNKTLRLSQVSLGLLAAAVVAQFVLAVVTVDIGEKAGKILLNGREREYQVVRSVTCAIRLNASVAIGNGLQAQLELDRLGSLASELRASRNFLYFADSATSNAFGTAGSLSAEQRALTFGGGQNSLDTRYLAWLTAIDSLVALRFTLQATSTSTNSMANSYAFSSATVFQVSAITQALQDSYQDLVAAIRLSNAQYDTDLSATVNRSLAPDVILLAVIVILIVVQLKFVFIPVTRQLADEETGTRLLLMMIPQNVRDNIPKIQSYLDSGLLVEEDAETRVYTKCSNVQIFLAKWSATDDHRACYDILNEGHVSQVLIDTKGIVVFANKHVNELLGYDDLEGRNISVIMDEPLRSMHDGFLERYVKQGVSRIAGGGRDVVAVKKSGERIRVYITIDDATNVDGTQYFLGSLDRYNPDDVREQNKHPR